MEFEHLQKNVGMIFSPGIPGACKDSNVKITGMANTFLFYTVHGNDGSGGYAIETIELLMCRMVQANYSSSGNK